MLCENWCAHLSLRPHFQLFWACTQEGIATSHGSSIFTILRNVQGAVRSGYSSLHSYRPRTGPCSSTSSPALDILGFFFRVATLMAVRWSCCSPLCPPPTKLGHMPHPYIWMEGLGCPQPPEWLWNPPSSLHTPSTACPGAWLPGSEYSSNTSPTRGHAASGGHPAMPGPTFTPNQLTSPVQMRACPSPNRCTRGP